MGKTILVTGKEGFLGNGISQFFLTQGCQVSVSVPPRKESFPSVDQDHRLLQFPWGRRSAVAAKNFVLRTLQEFGTLDEAWVVVTPERESFALGDLAPLAVDESLDASLKGTLYLVRELLQRQEQQPSLVLRFVFYDDDPATLPPLAAVHYQGLRGLVNALLSQARKKHTTVWAYESLVPRPEEFLTYLTTSPTTQPGRWNVLGERKTLINSLFSKKDAP